MDTKKIIKKFKTLNILNLVLFVVLLFVFIFLDKDVLTLLFPNAKFKGFSFSLTMLFAFLTTILYFTINFSIQMSISKILTKNCDPVTYKTVYFALSPKNNKIGKRMIEITAEFMQGNFDIAKTLCYDVIKNENNLSLRQTAYLTLCQIFLLENDVESLNYLRQSVIPAKNTSTKNGVVYGQIENTATVYIEFLTGDSTNMLKCYEKARELCKNKCDLYISLYYYALALLKNNRDEEAMPIFEEIMNNANGLFVANFAKRALLYYATVE